MRSKLIIENVLVILSVIALIVGVFLFAVMMTKKQTAKVIYTVNNQPLTEYMDTVSGEALDE